MGLSEVVPSTSRSIVQALGGGRMTAAFCVSVTGLVWLLAGGAPAANAADCANEATRVGASADLPNCRAYEMVSPGRQGRAGRRRQPGLRLRLRPGALDGRRKRRLRVLRRVLRTQLQRRHQQLPRPSRPRRLELRADLAADRTQSVAQHGSRRGVHARLRGVRVPRSLEPTAGSRRLAGTSNLYLRDNSDGSFSLVSAGAPPELGQSEWAPVAVSEDGSHVIFGQRDRTHARCLRNDLPVPLCLGPGDRNAHPRGKAARREREPRRGDPRRPDRLRRLVQSRPPDLQRRLPHLLRNPRPRGHAAGLLRSTTARPRKSPPRSGPRRPPPNRPTSSSPRMTAKSRSSPAPSC